MGGRRRVAGDDERSMRLPDARDLTWAEFGDPTGRAVVVLDGPGSRLQGRLAHTWAAGHGVRLLTPDRPGFFGSTAVADATFTSVADDLGMLLDHLGLDRVGVFALSGGTAFGCAVPSATRTGSSHSASSARSRHSTASGAAPGWTGPPPWRSCWVATPRPPWRG